MFLMLLYENLIAVSYLLAAKSREIVPLKSSVSRTENHLLCSVLSWTVEMYKKWLQIRARLRFLLYSPN